MALSLLNANKDPELLFSLVGSGVYGTAFALLNAHSNHFLVDNGSGAYKALAKACAFSGYCKSQIPCNEVHEIVATQSTFVM